VTAAADLFAGDGEVRALARALDWAATPLGPVDTWPAVLRSTVRTCLDSPFPINLWCGPELVLIYNDAYRHVLGAKHPGALGRPGSGVWAEIWGEIAPMFAQIRAGGPPVYADDAPFVVRRAGAADHETGPGGPNAWFTFALSAVRDEAGHVAAFLNVVSESTGRILAERAREAARARAEHAEARLRDVFAQAPSFMAVLRGPEHVFEYVNAAYYQLVGHRELLGRPIWEVLPEVRGQGFEGLLDRVLATGEPYVGREVPVTVTHTQGAEPEQRYIDLVYYPMTEADGTRSGVVAHGSDVTDHVVARREAQRARAEAEQANQAKSQFLANMSHEIRTPINAIVGYSDLLDAGVAGPLMEAQHRYVERIRASSGHLLGLVDDVLDLAKVEAGEMLVRMEETPAGTAVQAALHMMAPQAEARGLALREARECDEDVRFVGDEDRVRQILLNLLSNALKFTPAGGTVTVRSRTAASPDPDAALPETGPWVVIEVEDTGAGIPAEQLARIFDPFVQAEGGHTRPAGGTGLGLTISRRFARLMGGDLTVRSEVGGGSRFSLWLAPAVQEPVAPNGEGWTRGAEAPVPGDEPSGADAVGRVLLATAERMEAAVVERLRADGALPGTGGLSRAQVADHTASILAVMGTTLAALAVAPALAADGEEVLALLAGRRGQQRRLLGWARADVEREYHLLHEVLDAALRREAPKRTVAELGGALAAVHRLLDVAEAASLAGFDGGPG
jgi:PAS domain S-box-containing protein